MPTTLTAAAESYLRAKALSRGTRNEYHSTLRKWEQWGGGVPIEELQRKDVREFLDWVYERAVADEGTNPGRTANKAREHLRAVLSWAWEQELIDAPPRFPKPRAQRDVAGRHYLTKAEINALYFATHPMRRPRGWDAPFPVGRYWRAALVVFFNYGVDTGTVWKSAPAHEPILWRHVSWDRQSPDREVKEQSPWGWLFYRRVKTGKAFYRPMNRVVHAHLKSIMPADPRPDAPVFLGGGARPNARFQALCELAGIKPRANVETGRGGAVGAEGPAEDVRDVLRRARARVVGRDPRPLGRRDHLPPLRPPRPAGVQGDHDAAAADGVLGAGSRGSTASARAAGGDSPTPRNAGEVTDAQVRRLPWQRSHPAGVCLTAGPAGALQAGGGLLGGKDPTGRFSQLP